uniref:PPM-type phosphatase domain-containing protein n=1 Tax=Proboscia inermis TaxID=420281 RepID=A0A7S0C1E1_9STRA|mmetsp:Transcript_20329/g.20600  ORF Transcript_20329/g.20600 Transcript_20329/m.20600 type:complete len:386 (+) Transcript_20329:3-1160(+)
MIKGGDLVTSLSSNDVVRSNDINHVSSYKTQGMRPYQEDEMLIQGPNSHDANSSYFLGVFDGHGGHAVSRYLKQNLFAAYLLCRRRSRESSALLLKKVDGNSKNMQGSEELGNYFTPSIDEPGASVENLQNGNNFFDDDGLVRISINALQMAFEKVDQEVQRVSHWSFQGSTAVVVLLLKLQNQRIIVSANVGDSRAVVCQRYCPSKLNEGCNTVITAVDLTVDHKPNVLSERIRIEKLGGCITKPTSSGGVHRINGNLAVSRAIGDRSEKPWVSSQVDIKIHATSISTDVIDEFIIMASDGLWDVMSSAEAVSLCREYVERRHYKIGQYVDRKDMHDQLYWKDIYDEVPKYLTSEAIRRGSSDNISVIITWLRRDVGIDNGEDL